MTIYMEEGALLESDCTVIAHQMNCFGVKESNVAKQLAHRYPEVWEADKRYKLPPRERLGRFSFAPSKDGSRLIFHLYGQFRCGTDKERTDYDALAKALEMFFKAMKLAESKGFPVKIGMPQDLISDETGNARPPAIKLLEMLSACYQYDIHLYKD